MEDLKGVVQEMKTSLEALKAHLQVNPDDHEAVQVMHWDRRQPSADAAASAQRPVPSADHKPSLQTIQVFIQQCCYSMNSSVLCAVQPESPLPLSLHLPCSIVTCRAH